LRGASYIFYIGVKLCENGAVDRFYNIFFETVPLNYRGGYK